MSPRIPTRLLPTLATLKRPATVLVNAEASNVLITLGNISVRITNSRDVLTTSDTFLGQVGVNSYMIFANFDGDCNSLELVPEVGDWIVVSSTEAYKIDSVDIRPGGVENHHMEIKTSKSEMIAEWNDNS